MNTYLPDIVVELFDLIGQDETEALIEQFGGDSIFISEKGFCPPHIMISDAAWLILQGRFGGERVYIPKCHRQKLSERNKSIFNDRKIGMKVSQLCKKYNLTRSQIKLICASSYE